MRYPPMTERHLLDRAALKAARLTRGMTGKELAAAAGITSQYVSLMESGIRENPSEAILERLADALGVGIEVIAPHKLKLVPSTK